jgi:hypothetical protein
MRQGYAAFIAVNRKGLRVRQAAAPVGGIAYMAYAHAGARSVRLPIRGGIGHHAEAPVRTQKPAFFPCYAAGFLPAVLLGKEHIKKGTGYIQAIGRECGG